MRRISSSDGMASARAQSIEVGGGEQAFAGAQQVVEVGVQVGQVGDVGAEVVAAGAAEPERAGAAAGFDVGRFGADAERDGDLADGAAGVLGVQQRLGLPPDAVAVPVELHRGDAVDGFAAAGFADSVVAAGGFEFAVRHQLAQHLDGNAGVGVALGVAVPVGVEHDLALVVFDAVGGVQHRHSVDPGAVGEREGKPGDRAAPAGVAPVGGQQLQLADRGVRVAGPDSLLLGDDHVRRSAR